VADRFYLKADTEPTCPDDEKARLPTGLSPFRRLVADQAEAELGRDEVDGRSTDLTCRSPSLRIAVSPVRKIDQISSTERPAAAWILDQERPITAGRLAERARLSPGAMTALLDCLEAKGLARRSTGS
jgi:hypothetical protein